MSTKEKIHALIEIINPEDLDVIFRILEKFALTSQIPNEETVEAMLEAESIARNPDIKGFTDIKSLMEELNAEWNIS